MFSHDPSSSGGDPDPTVKILISDLPKNTLFLISRSLIHQTGLGPQKQSMQTQACLMYQTRCLDPDELGSKIGTPNERIFNNILL